MISEVQFVTIIGVVAQLEKITPYPADQYTSLDTLRSKILPIFPIS